MGWDWLCSASVCGFTTNEAVHHQMDLNQLKTPLKRDPRKTSRHRNNLIIRPQRPEIGNVSQSKPKCGWHLRHHISGIISLRITIYDSDLVSMDAANPLMIPNL